MTETSETAGDRQKVWTLIKDIRIALLVTSGDGGRMRGRPMAAMNEDFDGTLWFLTREQTPKLGDIAENAQVMLAYSEPKRQIYAAVAGTAGIVRDRERVKALWRESARVWFPKGPDDPDIALIRVDVESAEYWDAPSSLWIHAWGYAKATLTGRTPDAAGENKVVNF